MLVILANFCQGGMIDLTRSLIFKGNKTLIFCTEKSPLKIFVTNLVLNNNINSVLDYICDIGNMYYIYI